MRRAKSIEELLPWLYLKGISTGDFSEALAALLGPDAPGLSASTITRLKADWWDEYDRWSKRDLSARRHVYFAARSFGSGLTASVSRLGWNSSVKKSIRGIDFSENDRQCMLVIIGADEWGNKDVLGLIDGFRESTQSWRELLLDLNRRSAKRNAGGWRSP